MKYLSNFLLLFFLLLNIGVWADDDMEDEYEQESTIIKETKSKAEETKALEKTADKKTPQKPSEKTMLDDAKNLVKNAFGEKSSSTKKDDAYDDSDLLDGLVDSVAVTPELKMIKPLIKLSVKAAFKLLKEGVQTFTDKSKFCSRICQSLARVQCSYKNGVSLCKSVCTKPIALGSGYTIKIRFREDFSLKKCVLNGIKNNAHTQKIPTIDQVDDPLPGETHNYNEKAISIYSENDLELASQIIGQIRAYDIFILNNGHISLTRGESAEEIAKMVDVAREERSKLEKNFIGHVIKTFGPQ